jgi:hypothetical protein
MDRNCGFEHFIKFLNIDISAGKTENWTRAWSVKVERTIPVTVELFNPSQFNFYK